MCIARVAVRDLAADAVFSSADNDDVMRLLSTRSWLTGQSWFDMTQYGVLPPEGVSLHWTRYIDLGLGGLVALFGLFVPPSTAELWAVIVWPVLLLGALIVVTGYGTRRLVSPMAGIIAMFMIFVWAPISLGYFRPGRVDHHNVQILLLTIATFAALWPTAPTRSGVIVGAAAALSVTTGLETVFFLVGLGLLLVVQAAWNRDGARARLTAFSLSVAVGSTVLHLGQTTPSQWLHAMCDKLSVPYLLVIWIGALAALSFWALPARFRQPMPILCTTGGIAALGVLAAFPMLGPCLADPYSHLPQDVQALIAGNVIEALPLTAFAERYPLDALHRFQLPFAVLLLAAVFLLLEDRTRPAKVARAVGPLLFLALIGAMASFLQIRQAVLLAPMVPALAGYALAQPFELRAEGRDRLANFGLIGATLLVVLPIAAGERIVRALQSASDSAAIAEGEDANCALPSLLAGLDRLPSARVLSSINLGPKLAAFSHHAALTAPYHRSAEALANGFFPFRGDAAGLHSWAQEISADYVLVCEGSAYGDGAGTTLASGEQVAGFERIELGVEPLMLFAVVSDAE